VIVDTTKPHPDRVAAFRARADWFDETLDPGPPDQIVQMLERYGDMGLVEARQGVTGDPVIPPVLYVSDGHKPSTTATVTAAVSGARRQAPTAEGFRERLGQFPFGSAET
jgi:hypothetical protein